MVIRSREASSFSPKEEKREEGRRERGGKGGGFGSSALGHRDVMMGWDELGFAGGLPSVFGASAALRGLRFNPHRADLLPLPI